MYNLEDIVPVVDGNLEEKLADVSALIRSRHSAEDYVSRARIRSRLKDYDHAVKDYSKALKLEPDNTLLLLERAAAKAHGNNQRGAYYDIKKALEADPDCALAYYCRARLIEYGNTMGAVDDYRRCLELQPDHAMAHLYLGRLYRRIGETEEAIKHLARAIGLKPELARKALRHMV